MPEYPRLAAYLREVRDAHLAEAEQLLGDSDNSPSTWERASLHASLDAAEAAERRLAMLAPAARRRRRFSRKEAR